MIIKSVSKLKNQYEVVIDNHKIELDMSLIHKYHIKAGTEIEQRAFNAMMKDKQYFDLDQLGLKKLKRMHTVYEMRQLLKEAGSTDSMTRQLIDKYIKHKYLDDLGYAKAYISAKKQTYGPLFMRDFLKKKGISENVLEEAFKTYIEKEVIDHLIIKKIKKSNKKSLYQLKVNLYGQLVNKGFSPDLVKAMVSQSTQFNQVNESELVKDIFEKAYTKYLKTLDAKKAYQKALNKLYQSGFDYQIINEIIRSNAEDYLE